jgi:hypothetical protein
LPSYGTPFFQVAVDFNGLLFENGCRPEWVLIVVQAMDGDFKSTLRQALAQRCGDGVIPRNETERRPEAEAFFDLCQLITFIEALG